MSVAVISVPAKPGESVGFAPLIAAPPSILISPFTPTSTKLPAALPSTPEALSKAPTTAGREEPPVEKLAESDTTVTEAIDGE